MDFIRGFRKEVEKRIVERTRAKTSEGEKRADKKARQPAEDVGVGYRTTLTGVDNSGVGHPSRDHRVVGRNVGLTYGARKRMCS